jgi:SAM-dependent methyltransferase
MLARAHERLGAEAELLVADMRDLPALGRFGLVTCLNDSVNYLLDTEDVAAAFGSAARVLAPDGVYVFDALTPRLVAHAFRAGAQDEWGEGVVWRGEGPVGTEGVHAASMELHRGGEVQATRVLQRAYGRAELRELLARAGLEEVAAYGFAVGRGLAPVDDEERADRLFTLARHAGCPSSSP